MSDDSGIRRRILARLIHSGPATGPMLAWRAEEAIREHMPVCVAIENARRVVMREWLREDLRGLGLFQRAAVWWRIWRMCG